MQSDIYEKIKRVIESRGVKMVVGVVKDEDGGPMPFLPQDMVAEGNNIILFSIPRTNPAYSAIQKFPETSISLVDLESIWKWQDPTGLQVKGIAEQKGDKFSLEIFEVYDVIPRAGVDLNIPIFRKKLIWVKTKFSKNFKFPGKEVSVPGNVLQEVKNFIETTQGKGFPAYICTIDPLNGIPNMSPRWIVDVQPNFFLYGDSTRHKTQINAERPSPVCVMSFDPVTGTGYNLVGWNSISNDLSQKNKIEEYWKTKGFTASAIRVNLFHAEEIYRFSRISYTKIFSARPRNQWILS